MKKIVSLALTAVLTVGLCGTVAHAEELDTLNSDKIYDKVDKADTKIQKEIDKAVKQAQHLEDKFQKDVEELERDENGALKNPEKYDELTNILDMEIEKIIQDLVNDTNKIAEKAIRAAAEKGIQVVKEYILVQIGDHYVWIDPCRVLDD